MTTVARAGLVGVVAAVGFFAYINGVELAFVLVYAAVLVAALGAAWSWWAGRHLVLRRQAAGGTRVVGEELLERFTLENLSGLPVPYVEVRDQAQLTGSGVHRVLSLGPRQAVSWEESGRLSRRGRYLLGPTEIRVVDPFGIFPRRRLVPARDQVVVYPALVPVPDLEPGEHGPGFERSRPARGRDLPPNAGGIREHDPGDGLHRIHWISTARRGRLISRAFDADDSGDLLVLLDLCRHSHRGLAPESSLEYCVTLAASVASQALRRGRTVALCGSDAQARRIPSGRGQLHARALLDFLATAEADGEVGFGDLVRRSLPGWGGRGGVVLVTADTSTDWVEAAAGASRPGHRALGIFVDPAGFSGQDPTPIPAQWRLVLDLWLVRHGDDLGRLNALSGRAVV
ncbi:MAG: DUF58 domain-containing protein [Candidatus Dormibacteria bacterium]